MSNTITITGSTIGAMAVGGGAEASGRIGGSMASAASGETYHLKFEAKGYTREQLARYLRGLAGVLDDPEHPTMNFATAEGAASRAWTLTREPAK